MIYFPTSSVEITVSHSRIFQGEITLIDFPQMVSTSHANAEYYFDRDVQGIYYVIIIAVIVNFC